MGCNDQRKTNTGLARKGTDSMKKLIGWHRNFLYDTMVRFNLDEYHVAWAGFIEGLVIGFILGVWLF